MIVILYFQIKVRKRFIGDILHIVIVDLSYMDFECKNLVSRFGPREMIVSWHFGLVASAAYIGFSELIGWPYLDTWIFWLM